MFESIIQTFAYIVKMYLDLFAYNFIKRHIYEKKFKRNFR